MGDWSNREHTNPTWRALEGAEVVIRNNGIKGSDNYLGFSCLFNCGESWDGATRGVFDRTRANADRFRIVNKEAGFYIQPVDRVTTKVPGLLLATLEGYNRVVATRNRPEIWADRSIRWLPDYIVTDPHKPIVKDDGNYVVTTRLIGITDHPSEKESRRVANGRKEGWEASSRNLPNAGYTVAREFLMSGYAPVSTYNSDSEFFYVTVETLQPPDLDTWIDNPENKITCCEGIRNARTASSCTDRKGTNWLEAVANCDQYMTLLYRMGRAKDSDERFDCFRLEEEIQADFQLRTLGIPVSCVCPARGYRTQAMKDNARECGPKCVMIQNIYAEGKANQTVKGLSQLCSVVSNVDTSQATTTHTNNNTDGYSGGGDKKPAPRPRPSPGPPVNTGATILGVPRKTFYMGSGAVLTVVAVIAAVGILQRMRKPTHHRRKKPQSTASAQTVSGTASR